MPSLTFGQLSPRCCHKIQYKKNETASAASATFKAYIATRMAGSLPLEDGLFVNLPGNSWTVTSGSCAAVRCVA